MTKKSLAIRVEASSFLEHDTYSGVGRYTKLLCEELSRSSELELTTGPFFHSSDPVKKPSKTTTILNKIYRKLDSYSVPLPAFDISASSVDVTIFPNFATLPTKKSDITMCVIHDLTYIHYPELVEEKNLAYLRRVVPRSIERADFIITVSETTKDEIAETFDLHTDRIIVTPIPPDPIYFEISRNEVHNKYGIPTDKYILFIGNLEPRKNLSTLIKAYDQLPDKLKNTYSLVLAGDKGWGFEETQELIGTLKKSSPNITQVGFIDQADMPAFYQKASLFVLPSLYEGFGMPILEAMASNIPILASNIPVLHEVGGDGITYANPEDAADFSDKIRSLLDKPEHTEQTYSSWLKKFTWANTIKPIISKYPHESS